MGSHKWGYNMGHKYSYPTYNPTYNYPKTSKQRRSQVASQRTDLFNSAARSTSSASENALKFDVKGYPMGLALGAVTRVYYKGLRNQSEQDFGVPCSLMNTKEPSGTVS